MAAKGYDDSPTRNGTILFYTVLTVFVLIFVKFSLDSYFDKVFGGEFHDKVLARGMEEVQQMRAKEEQALGAGSMPVSRAKQLLIQRGRVASPVIAPESGMGATGGGMQEIAGWTKLDRKVAPAPVAPPAVDADAGVADAAAAVEAPAAEGAQR